MSSEVFEQHEEDFRVTIEDVSNKIREISTISGESRKRAIRLVERGIDEAKVLLGLMEDEACKAPQPYRSQQYSIIRQLRAEVDASQKSLMKVSNETGNRQDMLFHHDDGIDEFEHIETSQRARLLVGSDILERTGDSIARSHRIAAETDEVAVNTMAELGTQGEALQRTRDRLHNMDGDLSQSRKIIKTMTRRLITNKLILIFIIVLEVALLIGLIYWKFFS